MNYRSAISALLKLSVLVGLVVVFVPPESVEAQNRRRAKEEDTSKNSRRKYVHPCPAGTEQVGGGPPDGYKAHCRQPVVGGYRTHGTMTNWYPNGEKRFEGDYIRGKKHGVWTVYHRNGQKKSVETWQNGSRGEKVKFDAKGKPVEEVNRNQQRRERRKDYKWRNNMTH